MSKRKTLRERVERFMNRRQTAAHKQIVQYLLAEDGIAYGPITRRRYDKVLYGDYGFLTLRCAPMYRQPAWMLMDLSFLQLM